MDTKAFLGESKDNLKKKCSKMRRFYIALRKCEYYNNSKHGLFSSILLILWKCRYHRLAILLGWYIPLNVLGAGTRIMHPGTVVINENARIGTNGRIHVCVNIGASNGSKAAPLIGDHVYIGPGAKIFGDIVIADNIAIGANAVVNKSFTEPNITVAGVPAKKISEKGFDFG